MDSDTVYLEASKHKGVVNNIEAAERLLHEATAPILIVLSTQAVGRDHARKLRHLSAAAFRKGCVLVCDDADLQ